MNITKPYLIALLEDNNFPSVKTHKTIHPEISLTVASIASPYSLQMHKQRLSKLFSKWLVGTTRATSDLKWSSKCLVGLFIFSMDLILSGLDVDNELFFLSAT